MTVTDEDLVAYVDGELDPARAGEVGREIAASATLTHRFAEQKELRTRVRRAFDRTLDEPVPPRLVAAVSRGQVADLARTARRRPTRNTWLGGLALAASVVLGVAIGPMLMRVAREQPDFISTGANVTAGGSLANALSRRLASDPSASEPVRLGISFLAKSGEYCRTFITHHGASAFAGVACRQGTAWRVDALQTVIETRGDSSEYRQAATSLPPIVLAAAEASMAGDPLDAAGEAQARNRDWRPPDTNR